MKIRVSFDIDVTNVTVRSKERDSEGNLIWVPVTADNALAWYRYAFDAYPENYIEDFITNQKVEVIRHCTCGSIDGECPTSCTLGLP